jgi:Mor family transcriptional regulator
MEQQIMILDTLRAAIASAANPDEAVLKIQSALGGVEIYIPVPPKDFKQRNEQIIQAFNGRNHAEICRRFSISLATLYRVLRQKRQAKA